ncbi:MAG: hypothetical protein HY814_06770 [Candidatus Riflebacteria bacterium]|nr:hypothetical protein [Candidatus Riflebacteria bacterium]
MKRWTEPLFVLWDQLFAIVPRAGVWLARTLFFWGMLARSYLVRRGMVRRAPVLGRTPAPAAPAVRAPRVPTAVAGHARA